MLPVKAGFCVCMSVYECLCVGGGSGEGMGGCVDFQSLNFVLEYF